MAAITSYKDLVVWRRAMDLAENVYALTRSFPKQEEYRLTSQLIRESISIPANVAEGFVRSTRKDYASFISIARGSAAETETLLMLAGRFNFAPKAKIDELISLTDEIGRMLNTLRQRLSKPLSPKT